MATSSDRETRDAAPRGGVGSVALRIARVVGLAALAFVLFAPVVVTGSCDDASGCVETRTSLAGAVVGSLFGR